MDKAQFEECSAGEPHFVPSHRHVPLASLASMSQVLKLIDQDTTKRIHECPQNKSFVNEHLFPLLESLKGKGQLPALLFSLDR